MLNQSKKMVPGIIGVLTLALIAGVGNVSLAQGSPEQRVTTKVRQFPPDKKEVGLVYVDGKIFAFLPGTRDTSAGRRADLVRARIINLMRNGKSITPSSLGSKAYHNEFMVTAPASFLPSEAKHGQVITVDPRCADMMKLSPQEAARQLSRTLTRMLTHPKEANSIKVRGDEVGYQQAWDAFENGKASGNFDGAIKQCKKLIMDDPAYVSAYLLLLSCYKEQRDYSAMSQAVDAMTSLDYAKMSDTEKEGFWLQFNAIPVGNRPKLPAEWTPKPVDRKASHK